MTKMKRIKKVIEGDPMQKYFDSIGNASSGMCCAVCERPALSKDLFCALHTPRIEETVIAWERRIRG